MNAHKLEPQHVLMACMMVVATQSGGCSSNGTPAPKGTTIVYSGFAKSNTYWAGLGTAAAAEAKAKGAAFEDLTLADETGTPADRAAQQKKSIDDAIKTKPSAIIIGAIDPTVFTSTLAAAAAAGIPVLAADTALTITTGGTTSNDPNVKVLVQTDNLKSAQNLGDYICKKLAAANAKGSALVMAGTVGHQTGDARQKGVADKLAACGETVIPAYSDWDAAKATQLATDTMASTADLNVIFAPNGAGGVAVGNYVNGQGMSSKISVFSFDGQNVEFVAIQAGHEVATMKQDNVRIGQESVDDALAILDGQPFLTTDLIPGILVDSTNVSTYLVSP